MATLSHALAAINPAEALASAGYTPTPADLQELVGWYVQIDRPFTDEEADAMYARHLAEEAAERAMMELQTQSVADALFAGR